MLAVLIVVLCALLNLQSALGTVSITAAGAAGSDCSAFTDCVSCTNAKMVSLRDRADRCMWSESAACTPVTEQVQGQQTYTWEDTCPVSRTLDSDDYEYLSNWMGKLVGSGNFDKLTLLDLSLPGSHDTLTYDLSTTVSDGGADGMDHFAEVLHRFHRGVPGDIEDFIRQQAQTQALSIQEQLDNGIRFLDLRMMYEYTDKRDPDWYSLHFMQSNAKMLTYMTTIRDWMVQHPTEVVVMWLSKHGSTCATGNDAYPNTSTAIKQAFWANIEALFQGMTLSGNDKSAPPVRVNETSVVDMVARNARAVFYVSDYVETTGSSAEALDGCLIDNMLGPSVDDEIAAAEWEQNVFKGAAMTKFHDKRQQKLMLMSLATGVPSKVMVGQGDIRFLHHGDQESGGKIGVKECAGAFNIPGLSWCPPTLLDISSLENFYKQVTLEQAYAYRSMGWAFPNAIYINGVDTGGTVRTGTQVMWADGSPSAQTDSMHATTKYAYVDTIVAFNLYLACDPEAWHLHDDSPAAQQCRAMQELATSRRAKFPVSLWDDAVHGRHANWPVFKTRDT